MEHFRTEQVINGTYGQVWIGDTYLASLTAFSAKVELAYADVVKPRSMLKGRKIVGLEGSGEVTVQKYNSLGINLMSEKIKQGQTPVCKITASLTDPDAKGRETVVLNGVTFDDLTLFDFKNGEIAEEKLTFKFADYDVYDKIR